MAGDGNTPARDAPDDGFESAPLRRGVTVPATLIVLLFALCDMAIMPVLSTYNIFNPSYVNLLLFLTMSGAIVAQACLLSAWTVLGKGSAWELRVVELAVGALWLIAWGAGLLIALVLNRSNTPQVKGLLMGLYFPVV